jgi:hypothetical protein
MTSVASGHSPAFYRKVWREVCRRVGNRQPTHPYFSVKRVHGALRLHGWSTLRQAHHAPADVQEHTVHHTLHHRQDCPHSWQDFARAVESQKFSPNQELCRLWRRFPGLTHLMGLSDAQLNRKLRIPRIRRAAEQLVPDDWETPHKLHHFKVLLRSLELWLEAWHLLLS